MSPTSPGGAACAAAARGGQGAVIDAPPPPRAAPSRAESTLAAAFASAGGRTRLDRVFERGALRLRHPRGPACESIIVNTGGGIVAGDRLSLAFTAAAGSAVTVTSVAAEKVYRSDGATAEIATRLDLGAGSRLDWLPQETILFDGARLERRFAIDMAATATLVAAEIVVFGRLARGEEMRSGMLHDRWRLRRDGRLVFADDMRLEGAIAATLDRKAVGDGARAGALLLAVGPHVEAALDPLRDAVAPFQTDARETRLEAGASTRDGILIARLVARSPERLRFAMVAALGTVRSEPLPRIWL